MRHGSLKWMNSAVAGGLVLALAACAGGGSPTSTPSASKSAAPKPTEVSGSIVLAEPSDNPGDITLRKQLAAAFMKANPKIKVQVLIVPVTSYDQKIQTMIAGGRAPDIFGSGDVQIPNIVAKKLAVDLKPLADRDKYSLDDFYPQVLEGLTYNKQLVGLTDNWDTQVMYYNETLFKQAGVNPPTSDWTWQDFVSASQRLTSGSGSSKVYGAVFDNWFAPYYDQIWSWNGDPYPKNGTACGLASTESIAALKSILDLYRSGTSPTPSQFSGQGAEQLFLSGRVGMLLGSGRWGAYDLRDVKRFTWKVAPIPKGPAGRANFFHLSMFAIARGSKNPEAAWEFLKYMVSPEGIKQGLSAMQGIPSRRSIAESPEFSQAPFVVAHDAVKPFMDSLPTVHKAPYLPNFNQVQDGVDAQMDAVWALKKTPEQAMPALCSKIAPLLKGPGAGGGVPGGG